MSRTNRLVSHAHGIETAVLGVLLGIDAVAHQGTAWRRSGGDDR